MRQLIHNLLNYYKLKEYKYNKNQQYYFVYKSKLFQSEFECLSTENKIGIHSKFNDKKAIICLNLLKMLYDRDYNFLVCVYTYIIDNNIFDKNIKFDKTLDDCKLWTKMLSVYYDNNEINIIKYDEMPKSLKNYKTKCKQTFYHIDNIITDYYSCKT